MTRNPRAAALAAAILLLPFATPRLGSAHGTLEEALAAAAATHTPAERLRHAELLRLAGRFGEARAQLRRVAREEPSLADEAARARAQTFLDERRPAPARREMGRLLARRPEDAAARRLHARASLALGRAAEAADDLAAAVAATATPELVLERSRALTLAGRRVEALAALASGSARLGAPPALELEAAELETALGCHEAALARLDRLTPAFARQDALLERRGRVLLAAGRRGEARLAFAAALAELTSAPRRGAEASREREAQLRAAVAACADEESR